MIGCEEPYSLTESEGTAESAEIQTARIINGIS
jgi:hypothetical protein